jgi:hypothetical protein
MKLSLLVGTRCDVNAGAVYLAGCGTQNAASGKGAESFT